MDFFAHQAQARKQSRRMVALFVLAVIAIVGLIDLAEAHGRWRLADSRLLGSDRLDVYERVREG